MHINAAVEVRPDQGYGLNLDAAMKTALAARPRTPTWILEGLVGDEDGVVRYLLAGNPAAPVAVLARLSQDTCPNVRAEVAANPSTPVDVLEGLLEDEDEEVRRVAGFYLRKWIAKPTFRTPLPWL
jgi:hypothetical protein